MKLLRFCILFFIMSVVSGSAQADDEIVQLPRVIGPSPEVAALAKYVDMPVSHSTGVPQIEIPIHTVTDGSLQLPISLSYHAGGIKVSEYATTIGLGWSLMAGGVIGRNINQLPDDLYSTTYFNGYMQNDIYDIYDIPEVPTGMAYKSFFNGNDTEADLFFFSFGGYSGKFQYYKDKNDPNNRGFFHIKENNIKIEYTLNPLDQFVLTTPDGVKYYFGKNSDENRVANELSHTESFNINSQSQLSNNLDVFTSPVITAWYLMEIISPTGDKIEFYYEQRPEKTANISGQRYLALNPGSTCGYNYTSDTNFELNSMVSITQLNKPALSAIKTRNSSIVFEYDTVDRLDLLNSKKLNKIIIYNDANETNLLKQFLLNHDYFISAPPAQGYETILSGVSQIPIENKTRRLRLLNVQEQGFKNGQLISHPPYEFEYNNTQLPNRFSFQQDLWGYFNNKNNRTLIPKAWIDGRTIQQSNAFSQNSLDADRSVDIVNNQAGILTKIKYPTGGSTVFEYESNSISTILHKNHARSYLYRNRLNTKDFHFASGGNTINCNGTGDVCYEGVFEIGDNLAGNVFFKIDMGQNCTSAAIGCFVVKLFDENGDELPQWDSSPSGFNVVELNLAPGEYKLKASGWLDNNNNISDFSIDVKWEEDPYPNILYVGGLRVKSISKKDTNDDDLIKKTFDYNRDLTSQEENETNGSFTKTSSGIIGWWPLIAYTNYEYNDPYGLYCCTFNTTQMTSYGQTPLFEYKGGTTLYTQITERTIDINSHNDSYITEYFFDGEDLNLGVTFYHFPNYPIIDIYRGNLTKKILYNSSGYMVKKGEFNYDYLILGSYISTGIKPIPGNLAIYIDGGCIPTSKYFQHTQTNLVLRPSSTIETEYFSNGTIEHSTEYFYNSNPILPSHSETTFLEGTTTRVIETQYYYPFDLLPNSQMQNLIDQNRISQPIKVSKKVDGTYVNTNNTLFATNSNTSNLTLPVILQNEKGNGSNLENRINYDRYDQYGNLLQVSLTNGSKISYIYGYNHQYPVAKIENKAYNSIPSGLISAIHTASDSGNEIQLQTALNALRNDTAMANAMVTTYTYKPLVGITSITGPNGDMVEYFYDEFGRLESITDKEGNLMQEFEYNYGNN